MERREWIPHGKDPGWLWGLGLGFGVEGLGFGRGADLQDPSCTSSLLSSIPIPKRPWSLTLRVTKQSTSLGNEPPSDFVKKGFEFEHFDATKFTSQHDRY